MSVHKSIYILGISLLVLQFINDIHAFISPPVQGNPLPLILLGKSKNALLSTYLFLDQFVWLHRTGIKRTQIVHTLLRRFLFTVIWVHQFVLPWLRLGSLEGSQHQ